MRALVPLVLLGCSEISDKEASALVVANDAILPEVQARVDGIETLVSSARHGQGDGTYAVNGAVEPLTDRWTGSVEVAGTGLQQNGGTDVAYTLELTYVGVESAGVAYDGTFDVTFSSHYDDDISTFSYEIDGALALSGEGEGVAVMRYSMYAETGFDGFQHDGTVGGRPVDD